MKIIEKSTGTILAAITTNMSMTLEEACKLANISIMITEEDYDQENGYDINDLELIG